MQLNHANYHSREANAAYMSWHQFQSWMDCPDKARAELTGEYVRQEREPEKCPLFIGSYTHKAFLEPKEFPAWADANRSKICNTKGKPYATFEAADGMVATLNAVPEIRAIRDAGQAEVIRTAELFGVQWRAQMDLVLPTDDDDGDFIVDLKTTQDFALAWSDRHGCRVPWYEQYPYWGQLALYTAIHKAVTGRDAVGLLIGVTKQTPPDWAVVRMANFTRIQAELESVRENLPFVMAMKEGRAVVKGCGKNSCDWCRGHRSFEIVEAESINGKGKV